jgi:hypothetical protein
MITITGRTGPICASTVKGCPRVLFSLFTATGRVVHAEATGRNANEIACLEDGAMISIAGRKTRAGRLLCDRLALL